MKLLVKSALFGAVAAALLVFGHRQLSQAARTAAPSTPPAASASPGPAVAPPPRTEADAPAAPAPTDWFAIGPWAAIAFTLTTILTFGISRWRSDRRDAKAGR